MRHPIKYISNAPVKFIPKSHREDSTLSETNPDIFLRPMVFYVLKVTRDQQFKIREMLDLKDEDDPKRGVLGLGEVARMIWESNIVEVRNAIVEEADGVKTYESLTGQAKNDMWNSHGMDSEIAEAISFARSTDSFEESETKN